MIHMIFADQASQGQPLLEFNLIVIQAHVELDLVGLAHAFVDLFMSLRSHVKSAQTESLLCELLVF